MHVLQKKKLRIYKQILGVFPPSVKNKVYNRNLTKFKKRFSFVASNLVKSSDLSCRFITVAASPRERQSQLAIYCHDDGRKDKQGHL